MTPPPTDTLLGDEQTPSPARRTAPGSSKGALLAGGGGAVGVVGAVVIFLSQAGYLVTPAERERDRAAFQAQLAEVRDSVKDMQRDMKTLTEAITRSDRNAVTWRDLDMVFSELKAANATATPPLRVPTPSRSRSSIRFDREDEFANH